MTRVRCGQPNQNCYHAPFERKNDRSITLGKNEIRCLYQRLSELEKRQDSLYAALKLGSCALLGGAVAIGVYQNGNAVQAGVEWGIERTVKVWQNFLSLFGSENPSSYG